MAGNAGGAAGVPRNRWGQPLIVPPGETEPVGYQRTTTFVSALDDNFGLNAWKMRTLAVGLADRPDLAISAAAHRNDKKQLDEITKQALDAAQASAKSNIGTALHKITELIDEGSPTGPIPEAVRADVNSYMIATKPFSVIHSERFVVNDELRVAGTPDRIVEYQDQQFIWDLKTSQSLDFGVQKFCMQLAMYSRSVFYDFDTHERTELGPVSQDYGVICHLPSGSGQCRLYWVDLNAGWYAITLAARVREWRQRKDLLSPLF